MHMKLNERMNFVKIKWIFSLIFFIPIASAFAQPAIEFGICNGLSDITCSKTTAILEDSIGYLWIGTEEGLFRFDGQTVYPYFNDKNNIKSLPSNHIQELVLDKENNLWVATSKGICKYNQKFDCFTGIPDKSDMKGFANCFIKDFAFDNTGQLFVAYNQLIYTYNKSEGQFVKMVELDHGKINSLVFDDQNNLWIGASMNGGLYCFDQKKKLLTTLLNFPSNKKSISVNEINNLAISGQTLWIGTSGKGINTYDLGNKTFKHYSFSNELENYINSIFIGKDKKVWVCTYSCLKLFNPKSDSFYDYYNNPQFPWTVEKSLQGFYEDRAGNYWTIHSTNGVRLARNNIKIQRIEGNTGLFWTTSEKIITTLAFDRLDNLWIGNYYNGIDIFDWQKYKKGRLKHDENNPKSITDGTISAIFRDSKKQMWVGSYPGGLQKYNPETNDFDSYTHHFDDSLSLSRNDVRSIVEDSNGDLWMAILGEGVDRFDVRKKTFQHYNSKNNNLISSYTSQVLIDSRQDLWVATGSGLGFLHKGEQVFKNYIHNDSDSSSIGNNDIHTVYEDNSHNIWIGTDDGINKFNYKTQKFSRYSLGLKNKHIASIISDKNNNIWVSTYAGISRFDSTTLKFTNYDQNYGLLSKDYYERSCLRDNAGTLFFGGSLGFDTFNPDNLKEEVRKPKVVLTDFKLFNKSITCLNDSQIIDQHISYAKNIFLDFFQNSISFFYQAIYLTESNNIEYAYKLDGFDNNWVYAGKEREASYTNLNPGEYTFKVKAKFENGEWSPFETTIKLNVHPAWWMTLWFKILMGFIVVATTFAVVQYRIKRLQNQREILKGLVAERTSEIQSKNELLNSQALVLLEQNDQLKDLNTTKNKLFSIIAHDLRGPFNVILGFQNILITDYNNCTEEERIDMVKKTYSAAQKVFYLVDNLLNWARIQNSSIQYKPVLFDVKEMITPRMDLYLNIAEAKGISFENLLPDGLIAFADIDLLETILRNLINNAVKFTPVGGSIQVKASHQDHLIQFSVTDSGIGMTREKIETLFIPENTQSSSGTNGEKGSGLGLLLCKEFVEKHNGSITVESQPGMGSTFIFTIPASTLEHHQIEMKNLGAMQ